MYNLYEKIIWLCNQKGIKPGKMCSETGISRGLITDLKMGRKSNPTAETLFKIASYFGVTVDYLLGNEKKAPVDTGAREHVYTAVNAGGGGADIPQESLAAISDQRRAQKERTDTMKMEIWDYLREHRFTEEKLDYIKTFIRAVYEKD